MDQLAPDGVEAESGVDGLHRFPERGTLSRPEAAWAEAPRRAAVIGSFSAG